MCCNISQMITKNLRNRWSSAVLSSQANHPSKHLLEQVCVFVLRTCIFAVSSNGFQFYRVFNQYKNTNYQKWLSRCTIRRWSQQSWRLITHLFFVGWVSMSVSEYLDYCNYINLPFHILRKSQPGETSSAQLSISNFMPLVHPTGAMEHSYAEIWFIAKSQLGPFMSPLHGFCVLR